jgi:RNA polymerase sigma-70 factor (ECF subfamily)
MGDDADSSTSATLLRLLCGPGRDEQAWRRFFDRYEPLIGRWCRRWGLQAADAEDLTQKVLARVFTRINTYDPDRGGFRGWLKTVLENAIKDFLRGLRRRPADRGTGDSDVAELLQAVAQPGTLDGLVHDLDSSLLRDLEALLARVEQEVEPDTMRAFRLTVLDGRPIADVARELGKSYAAVCMAVNRVKKKVRAEGARLNERPPTAEEAPP